MTAPSSITFADLLRHHRAAAGLTQEELAARARLSVDAISTLERGARRRPRKDTVTLLAHALALPEEERAALAAAARRSSAAALAATPPVDAPADLNGHAPATASFTEHAPDAARDATLPHGVITFLIAEVADPMGLLHALGDRYAGLLAEMQTLLGTVWAAHAGHELGTQGDRFFAVFADADAALAAAAAAQQALAAHSWSEGLEGTQVRLRMGLHSGAALLTAGRYVGQEVHRAACIAAAGHGGQVVVSGAVAEQVTKFGYELPAGTSLRSLGKHRLAGLPHREQLYQLVLPDLPGLPASYPPLHTLDAWPGLRADLTVVVGMSAVLLAAVGLLLALVVPAFPWEIGLTAAGLASAVLLAAVLAQPVRRALETQWRDARKPVSAVTSTLLSLVVVVTALFITKPPVIIAPAPNPFSYTYHAPTRTGGSVIIGSGLPMKTFLPPIVTNLPDEVFHAVWNACVVQLPDLKLGFDGWKADQCSDVPTVANREEDPAGRWTIFHIDPRAVWSDGVPITASDFLFTFRLATDPNVQGVAWPCQCSYIAPPWSLMTLTSPDPQTVRIDWSVPYGDYKAALAQLTPLPLHVYARGAYAGVFNSATGAYDTKLARRLAGEPTFNLWLPVDNGPFTMQAVDFPFPAYVSTKLGAVARRLVLARNPHFFSRFFHKPALDRVTFEEYWPPALFLAGDLSGSDQKIAAYRQGGLTVADTLTPFELTKLVGIATGEVLTSPRAQIITLGFNQRAAAPNARANGGVSIFSDPTVRKAFTEAVDRCGALNAVLGIRNCLDPNFHTDEHAAPPSPDYDSTFSLPPYNSKEAGALLDQAGYRVVGHVRRYKDGTTPLQLILSPLLDQNSRVGLAMAKRLQQDLARSLQIVVQIQPDADTVAGAFDIGQWDEGVGPDPILNMSSLEFDSADILSAQNPNGENWLGLDDPWVVAEEQLAKQTVDDAQRAEVYKAIARHVAEQYDFLPLDIFADIALVKPTLCNFKQWPELGFYLWNMADWYVAPSCP